MPIKGKNTQIAIRDIPLADVPPALVGTMTDIREALISLQEWRTSQETTIRTLEQLLRGTAIKDALQRSEELPAVPVFRVETFPSTIVFYIPPENAAALGANVELYRAVGEGSTSVQAQRVQVVDSTNRVINDSPPPGETYRYWLRYERSRPASLGQAAVQQFGPFSPRNGVLFTAVGTLDPEDEFDPTTSGVFLETFEGQDFEATWQKYDGGAPALSYQNTGVVGGKVLRVAGAEEWRAFRRVFEFEPGQLYRMKIGLRLTAAPTNASNDRLRAGFLCFDVNQTVLDTTGGSSYASAHWFCAFDVDLGAVALTTYQEFTGYLQGLGTTPANNASDVSNPSVARSGTKYWSPVIVVNYDDGDGTTEIDYVRVERLNPLDVAFGGELTNESVTLPADNAGNVLSYSGATGTFKVRYGTQPIDPTRVTFSIVANPQSLTASIDTAGAFSVTAGFDSGEATASLTFRASYQGSLIERTFSIAKALSGADGADGTVTGVRLLADNQIFTFDQNGTAAPTSQTITFTSLRNGVTDPTTWTTTPTVTLGGVGDTRTLTIANFGSNTSVKVRAESEGYFDEVTIHRLQAGKDAVVAILTNEAIVLPASSTGVVSTYSGASGFLNVFNGTVDVTSSATKTVQSNPQSLTVTGPNATTGAWSITGGFDAGENVATLNFRAVYGGVTIDKTVFLTKAFTGATGEAGEDGIDGTNGTNGSPGAPGPALFTLANFANVTIPTPNSLTKSSGGVTWNGGAYSPQGYPSCFAVARPGQTNAAIMFGLSSSTAFPTPGNTYADIEYAIYLRNDGTIEVYRSGAAISAHGAYTTSSTPSITYDGRMVRIIIGGQVVYSTPLLGATLYFKAAFHGLGSLLDISFGPMGRAGDLNAQLIFLETWEHQSWQSYWVRNLGTFTITYPQNGQFGGRVLRATGPMYIVGLELFPFDPATLYKVTTAVRRVGAGTGSQLAYLGLQCFNAAGASLGWLWNTMNGINLGALTDGQWYTHTGYVRGTTATPADGVAPNVDSPTPVFNGTAYIKPRLVLNWDTSTSGIQECDYVRIERLTSPDDADNTDKRRLAPDAEFSLDTASTYWLRLNAPGFSIVTSGGFNGGYASWNLGAGVSQAVFGRRNPPAQGLSKQQFIVTVRWRRRNTASNNGLNQGVLRFGVWRHNDPTGNPLLASGITESYGGVTLYTEDINSRPLDAWQEDVGLAVLPDNRSPYTSIQLPYGAAAMFAQNFGGGTIEIDYFDVSPGSPASLPNLVIPGTSTAFMAPWDKYHVVVHDSASPRTFSLDNISTTLGLLKGCKVYFYQKGSGTLNISYSGTLLSTPNVTTNPRALLGRGAKAMAEYTGDGVGSANNTWTLTGELA